MANGDRVIVNNRLGKALVHDGAWSAASVSFGVARTPSTTRPTLVVARIRVQASGITAGVITIDVTGQNAMSGHTVGPGVSSYVESSISFIVGPGKSYTINNTADPATANTITSVREKRL